MSKKNLAIWGVCFLFTAIGTYNSVVIESTSILDSSTHTLVKRLDHQGLSRPARMVASQTTWQRLRPITVQKQVAELPAASNKNNASTETTVNSHVSEDLNLLLVEVINPDKFKNGLASSDFAGTLTTNGPQIETLEISLPQGLAVSISYAEIQGNVFEYEMNGEVLSGMLYQVDQHAYMVSFTAGELAGTRLRFQVPSSMEEVTDEVAQVDVGQFGQEGYQAEEMANLDRELQQEGINGAVFEF